MSKSLGNTILPQTIADKNGADILRLWVASSDFTEDLRIGQRHHQGQCRRLSPPAQHHPLHARQSRRLRGKRTHRAGRDAGARALHAGASSPNSMAWCATATRNTISTASSTRCSLSAPTSCRRSISTSARIRSIATAGTAPRRRAARTVIDEIFRRVVTWLAPILCFTMEEAWLLRFPGETRACICRPSRRRRPPGTTTALIEKWDRIRALRRVVTGALEIARRDKVIGASLEARARAVMCRRSRCGAARRARSRAKSRSPRARMSRPTSRPPMRSGCRTSPASRPCSIMPKATNARAAG